MPKYGGQTKILFGIHFNTDKSSILGVKKSLQLLGSIKLNNFAGSQDDLIKLQGTAKDLQRMLTEAFNVKLNTVNVDKFNQSLKNSTHTIQSIYNDFSKAGAAGERAFTQMASSVLTTNLQLKQTHSLINQMGTTMMNTVKWGIASSVFNNITQSVSQAFNYVKSLDSALTDIRIVTGDSREEMAKFAEEANRSAQALGRSTMEYSKAALTFYQQGLSDEDVQARTEATLKAQNITGAGSEMADYLTAVWNGYKVANEEALLYVDKLAAVADSSASNMSLLATAMSKVASTANMLGVPVDSLNAQIATIVATTRQAPESVGNALKTIYARINDIATGADDAEISLGNYSKKMLEVGVSVLDANGNLRDTGDVIELIGGKWESYSREQQIYLARTMAGQRQYNNLLALFENWGKYTDLVNVSLDAQGATMEKNSRYMESLEAHLNQLGAANERVKSAMINADSFKGLVDVGTGITTVFANFIESIGGGGNALLMFGSLFTSIFSGTIAKELSNFIGNIQAARSNLAQLAADKELTKSFEGVGGKQLDELLEYKKQFQQVYSIMSTEEINSFNNGLKRVAQLEDQQNLLTDIYNATKAIADALNKSRFILLGKDVSYNAWKENLEYQLEGLDKLNLKSQLAKNGFTQLGAGIQAAIGPETFASFNTSGNTLELLQQKLANNEITTRLFNLAIREVAVKLLTLDPSKLAEVEQKMKDAEALTKRAKDAIEQYLKEVQKTSNIQAFTKALSGVGQLASGINSLVNITKVWSNENLSTGLKVLQTFTSLSMGVGMVVNGVKNMYPLMVKISAALLGESAAAAGATVAEEAHANALMRVAAAAGKAMASIWPFLLIAGIIAGIVVAVKLLSDAWNSDAIAALKASKAAAQAKEDYDAVKKSLDDLKKSLDNLNNSYDAIEELTVGTQLWRDAVREVNEEVLALIEKYPELAGLVLNVNGVLKISEEGQERALLLQEAAVDAAQRASVAATQNSRDLNITSQATNLTRSTHTDFSSQSMASAAMGGFTPSLNSKDAIEIVKALDSAEKLLVSSTDLQKGSLEYTKALAEKISLQTGKEEFLIESLLKDVEGVENLRQAILENTTATKLLNETLVAQMLQDKSEYTGASDEDQKVMTAIGGAEYGQLVEDLTSLWRLTLKGYWRTSELTDSNIKEGDAIVEAVSKTLGRNLIASDNSIQGGGNQRTFEFIDADNGEKVTRNVEQVASIMATKQAMLEFGASTEQATEILKSIDSQNLSLGAKDAIRGLISGSGLLNLTKEQIEELKNANIPLIFSELQQKLIAESMGVSVENLTSEIDNQFNAVEAQLNNYLEGRSKAVVLQFKLNGGQIDTDQMSLLAKRSIADNLQKAFEEGGREGLLSLSDFYSKISDVEALNLLSSEMDFTNMSAEQLDTALKNAGIATDLTTQELEAYIKAQQQAALVINPEETYKSVHDIIDKLKTGDTIDALQAAALETAGIQLDGYFTHMADGTLKLKGDALEFFEYANNQSLLGFKLQIESLKLQNTQLLSWGKSDYAYQLGGKDNNARFSEFSTSASGAAQGTTGYNAQLLLQQLAFLLAIGVQEEAIADTKDRIAEHENVETADLNRIALLVQQNRGNWLAVLGKIKDNTEQIGIYEEELENANTTAKLIADSMHELDADVDLDQWESLSEYLENYADQIEEIDDVVKDNELSANDLALAMLRYDSALEDVADHYEDWLKALTSGSMQEAVEAGDQLQNTYADLLDLPFESALSPDFTQDVLNLHLLQLAANGSELAYAQLQERAAQDILAQVGLDASQFYIDQDAIYDSLNELTGQSWDDIKIGALLNDLAFLNELTNMVNAAGMTAEQATDYLASMGIDAVVKENDSSTQLTQLAVGFRPVATGPETFTELVSYFTPDGQIATGQVHYAAQGYSYLAVPIQQTAKKENKAFSLEVKSAKKSSGGGFKFQQASHGGGSKAPSTKTGGGSCFAAGTLVTTQFNLFKKIEKVKVGDLVLSYNEETKQNELSEVLQTMIHKKYERIYTIKVGKLKLIVTGIHRFLITRNNILSWIPASELQIGDLVLLANGSKQKITKIKSKLKKIKVYNFEVSNNHNYYVGQLQILAHNKGGSGAKPKQPTQAKTVTKAKPTKKKETVANPYEQVEKSYDRQEQQLKRLEKIEKKVTGKDRLKNLNDQIKALLKQNKIIQKRNAISDSTKKGSTNWFKNLITNDEAFKKLGDDLFDSDGKFKSRTALENAAVDAYNKSVKDADAVLSAAEDKYNDYILNTYNKMTAEQQEAAKAQKQIYDDDLKAAQDTQKDAVKAAELAYKKRMDLLKDYENALKEDEEFYQQYLENIEAIIEKNILKTTLKLTISIDTGEAERDYLEFENKVIKKLNKDDILGNAEASFKRLTTYFDSGLIKNAQNAITNLELQIADVQKKGWSVHLGITEDEWKNLKPEDQKVLKENTLESLREELDEANKTLMDNMMEVQDIIDDIKEAYLDAIDDVSDKMGDQIDQYERVNDLIDHGVKMTLLLYGDKGYETLNKYYTLQDQNNRKLLESLKMQQDYWKLKMNQLVVGSDAWKKFKLNLDDVTEQLNSKMEEMIENLGKIFENKISAAVDAVNNKMTGGAGLDYVDEQWDYMSNYDDYFLDTFNTKMGIDDVTRTYENALANTAGNPKQYQRINKLMNDQLKILKLKDKLTEYDLERAKSMLEVEQARMALEDARNNKTKMRLRRDSQGNYTYQYVADELKLGDLQAALADAQNNLYNQDKEHYKENLNKLYDTYKDYIEKMKDLTAEYNATQDEAERKRIKLRMQLLKDSASTMMEGLTEDNQYNLQYVLLSYASGMSIDLSKYSPEEQMEMLKENVPFVAGKVQELSDKITAEGGLLPATKDYIKTLNDAIVDYDKNMKQILELGGTSLETITLVTDKYGEALDENITNALNLITANGKLIASCEAEMSAMQEMLNLLDQYMDGVIDIESLVATIQNGFNTRQDLAGGNSKVKADTNVEIALQLIDTTEGKEKKVKSPQQAAKSIINSVENDDYNSRYEAYKNYNKDQNILDTLIGEKYDSDINRIIDDILNGGSFDYKTVIKTVQQMAKNQAMLDELALMGKFASTVLGDTSNTDFKNAYNDIVINATFPDVKNVKDIEEAFKNLIAIASMKASEKLK